MAKYVKSKMFGANIEPACYYCERGSFAYDKKMILCKKKGITAPFYRCKKFIYAPLKRVPKKQPALGNFTPEDFQL